MTKTNKNSSSEQLIIVKKYIKDLSFENPKSFTLIDDNFNTEHINISFNVISKPIDNNHIEVVLQIKCNCSKEREVLFCLELDYIGFFKKINNRGIDEDTIIKEAVRLLFPFAKSIVQDVSENGGFVTISLPEQILNDLDLNYKTKI